LLRLLTSAAGVAADPSVLTMSAMDAAVES
jgi:hypothetical protein